MKMSALVTMTRAEVATHNGSDPSKPVLVIINGHVLDVTEFKHPGGMQILRDYAGKDITKEFYGLHRHEVLQARLKILQVARVADYDAKQDPIPWDAVSPFSFAETEMDSSPYYKESHKRLRLVVRKFLWESGVYEWCNRNEVEGGEPPRELLEKMGKFGLFAISVEPGPHLDSIPEPNVWSLTGIKIHELDAFHGSIINQEVSRMICPGAADGIFARGIAIGPLVNFGKSEVTKKVSVDVLLGTASACLGITEPGGGTDVAGVKTRARRVPDGYLVVGSKKFITGAMHSEYCVALVRMDDNNKLSVLMIPLKGTKGVAVKPIPLTYSKSAGTALIVFDNVFVPSDHLLGREGQGLEIILHNFNGERLSICGTLLARCRRVVEETFIWARQREAFGKHLSDMASVRLRLGELLSDLMLMDAAYERLVYRYSIMDREERNAKLGGSTAILKHAITRATGRICDQALNLIGGRGMAETGQGVIVNRVFRSYKIFSIGGGTEDAMLDLGVRLTLAKDLPKNARL